MKFPKIAAAASALLLTTFAVPAHADWKSVETDHFIYYSEDDVDQIRENVTNLEKFDTLVRAITGNTKPPSEVKVRIFELRDMDELNRRLGSFGVGGFYNNNDMGPYLFTFRKSLKETRTARRTQQQSIHWGPQVRQHEYLHHYMYQYFYANYPSWYSEGFAEYYGSMTFPEENVVEIGHAPHFRMQAMSQGKWVPAEQLLTARGYDEVDNVSGLYAQGWLLTHMAARDPEVGKQLADYLNRLVNGEAYKDAAQAAFGDFDALDKKLRAHRKKLQAVRLSLKPIEVPIAEIREYGEFESDMFTYIMRLNMGMRENAITMAREHVREERASNPDNLLGIEVQARLAQADQAYDDELAMGERLLSLDPDSALGKYFKGHALVMLGDKEEDASKVNEGRVLLAESARMDLTNPEPLIDFYRSYLIDDEVPPPEALAALMKAYELLPGHTQIRMYAARDYEWRQMYEEALYVLRPIALGSFEGDEKTRERREKAVAEAIEKYGRLVVADTPMEMYRRLEAKRDGRWDEATQTIIGEETEGETDADTVAAAS